MSWHHIPEETAVASTEDNNTVATESNAREDDDSSEDENATRENKESDAESDNDNTPPTLTVGNPNIVAIGDYVEVLSTVANA